MASLKDHLIAHYKMNDDAATAVVIDETGDHNGEYQIAGVAQNTDTGNETGKINGALDFVGGANGEHIEIADHYDFSLIGTPLSISLWVYMHNATGFPIASKGDYGIHGEWAFYVHSTGNKLRFIIIDDSTNGNVGRYYNYDMSGYENQWLHIVVTYDGGTTPSSVKLYLNGVRVDDTDIDTETFTSIENLGGALEIGKERTTYANGLIDNVMFFNKDLTIVDVRSLYNGGAGTENIPSGIQLSRTGQHFSSHQLI